MLQLPPALSLTDQSQGDQPQSSSPSERVMTLDESMRQLERGTQSGTLCFHFEVFKNQAENSLFVFKVDVKAGAEYFFI